MDLRRRTEAFAVAERAVEMAGAPIHELLQTVAQSTTSSNDPGARQVTALPGTRQAPCDPTLLYTAALSHFYLNEMDEADALLARVLDLAPGNGFALQVRSQLATQTRVANHIAELRAVLARPRLRDVDAMLTSFALAKELEDIGEYRAVVRRIAAGKPHQAANAHLRRGERRARDAERHESLFPRKRWRQSPAATRRPARSSSSACPGPERRWWNGYWTVTPRSTSVGEAVDFPVEMAASARADHARLESTDPDLVRASLQMDFGELGRNYLGAVRQLAGAATYTIDKLPFNFRYCGLIHKALPKASIVHLTRDPMDTCYAVFKTLFINAYHFSYQLDELAEYFVAYRRMMDHWHAVMPGVILDVSYEELVSDPETQCRRLLTHCGLPWQDAGARLPPLRRKASTTASTVQVRQTDLPVLGAEVAQLRSRAAARAAPAGRGRARRRGRQSAALSSLSRPRHPGGPRRCRPTAPDPRARRDPFRSPRGARGAPR